MKNTWINIASIALITCISLNSCDFTSSRNYMGTMAGAEIGGVVGEALGWMSTDRHDGPGKAMLGSVIGTVAGAMIGNTLTKDRPVYDEAPIYNDNYSYNEPQRNNYNRDNYNRNYNDDYQISGGYNDDNSRRKSKYDKRNPQSYQYDNYSSLIIKNVYFQDEDGDGRISRNETVNIIYEVTNTSKVRYNDVVLKVETINNERNFALSPATTVDIAPGETLRYKAKAFCKSRPTANIAEFRVSANSPKAGYTSSELQIRMNK